jgi:hypothetical protein
LRALEHLLYPQLIEVKQASRAAPATHSPL